VGEVHRAPKELAHAVGQSVPWWLVVQGSLGLLAYWVAARAWAGRRFTSVRVFGLVACTAVLGLILVVFEPPVWSVLLLVIVIAVLLARPGRAEQAAAGESPPSAGGLEIWHGALVMAGIAIAAFGLGRQVVLSPGHLGVILAHALSPNGLVEASLQLVWCALALGWLWKAVRGHGRFWVPGWIAGALAAAVVIWRSLATASYMPWPGGMVGGVLPGFVLATLGLLLGLLVSAGLVGERARRMAQPMWVAVALVAVAVAMLSVPRLARAHAGMTGYLSTGTRALDAALQTIDGYVVKFRDANGCYPVSLAQLPGSGLPPGGVDSSGNPVQVTRLSRDDMAPELQNPLGDGEPPVDSLPVDPLTGRKDTWVYEPTGSPMVDSGGYRIRLQLVGIDTDRQPESYYKAGASSTAASAYEAPTGETEPSDREFSASTDALRAAFVRPRKTGVTRVAANCGAHAAHLSTAHVAADLIVPSPDGAQAVLLENGEHAAVMGIADLDEGALRPMPASPLLRWVFTLDWSPVAQEWLAVTGPTSRQGGPTTVCVISKAGKVRQVGKAGNYLGARYAAGGEQALVVTGGAPPKLSWQPLSQLPPPDGNLWVMDLQSGEIRPLCDRASLGSVRLAGDRTAFVSLDPPSVRVGVLSSDGVDWFDLPRANATVTDALPGRDALFVATTGGPQPAGRRPQGDIWRVPEKTGKRQHMGRWTADREDSYLRILGQPRGRLDACMVYYYSHAAAHEGVYVLGTASPRLERLMTERRLLDAGVISVEVDGQSVKARFTGCIRLPDFRPGDLLAEAFGGVPGSASLVLESASDHLSTMPYEVRFGNPETPTIGLDAEQLGMRLRPLKPLPQ